MENEYRIRRDTTNGTADSFVKAQNPRAALEKARRQFAQGTNFRVVK